MVGGSIVRVALQERGNEECPRILPEQEIRPEALKLDQSRDDAQRASDRLLEQLQQFGKNPTIAYRVTTGHGTQLPFALSKRTSQSSTAPKIGLTVPPLATRSKSSLKLREIFG
jgi:hypothetical protein